MSSPRDEDPASLTIEAASRIFHALRDEDRAAAPTTPCDSSLPPGYTLVQGLGAGGGGFVYSVYRDGSDRPLALKILSMPLGSSRDAQRAWRELDLLESLRLPTVPRLLDYGTHDGRLFFATELIEGRQPHVVARQDALDRQARVELLARICEAVRTLHEHGVIHRDLKPANILITPGGEVVILDLGLAALLTDDVSTTLTSDGHPIGTPAFMAPEQARGERSRFSTRTDVYSLGAIGYLLLTDNTPHDVNTPIYEAVRRVAQDPPRPPLSLEPTLPRPLAAVLEKACSPTPERRYPGAIDLASDLRRWLSGEPVEAHPPGPWRRAIAWIAKHPVVTTSVACMAMVIATVMVTETSLWLLNRRPYEVVIENEGRSARLISYRDVTLHSWHTTQAHGIIFGEIVERHAAFGGGRVVVMSLGKTMARNPWDEQISVWDTSDLSQPIWHTGDTAKGLRAPRENLPLVTGEHVRNSNPDHEWYRATDRPIIADIFPESPGVEVVVRHQHHMYDPACIRVYDLSGNVLFEAWHWGGGGDRIWLSGPRLLICEALNNEYRQDALGMTFQDNWPRVIFAIRPEFGRRQGWVNPRMAREGETAVWYRCFLPPRELAPHYVVPAHPPLPAQRDTHVDVTVFIRDTDETLIFRLDEHGQAVYTIEADAYRHAITRGDPTRPKPHAGWITDVPEPRHPGGQPQPVLRPESSVGG